MNPQGEKVMWRYQRRKQSKTKQNTKKIIKILRELTVETTVRKKMLLVRKPQTNKQQKPKNFQRNKIIFRN